MAAARDNCGQAAIANNADPAHCTLEALDDQQFWDPRTSCLRCMALRTMMSGEPVIPGNLQTQWGGASAANEDVVACAETAEGPACQDPDGEWYAVDALPADGLDAGVRGLKFYLRSAVHRDPRRHLSHRAAREIAARWQAHEVQHARMDAQANVTRLRAQQMPRGFPPRQVPAQFFRPQPARVLQQGHVVVPQYPVVRPVPRQQNCRPNQQFCR